MVYEDTPCKPNGLKNTKQWLFKNKKMQKVLYEE